MLRLLLTTLLVCLITSCTNTAERETAKAGDWEEYRPGGETRCSDGSEYRVYVREGDPDKLVFYLEGGGGCWMRQNCDPAMQPSYTINLNNFDPNRSRGMFDRDNPNNPFKDHSIVFAPYCSGDVHLGASDTVYAPVEEGQAPLTIYHRGFANAGAALDLAVQRFGNASEVLVTGSSAGAIPSPYYAVHAAQQFPHARITQLGDGAGGYRRRESNDAQPHVQWGTLPVLTKTPAFAGLDNTTFNYEQLYIRAGKAHPEIQFARYDAMEDAVQRMFLSMGGAETRELAALLLANNNDIRAEIDNFAAYIAGGDSHTILGRPEFYSYSVGDLSVRDWVAGLARGDSTGDVTCTDCRLPDFAGFETPDSLKDLWLSWESPKQRVKPFKIFDNVYYVGIDWVAAYVIRTSEGLILIDSLYGNWGRQLPDQITALGLNPGDVKYVILTHGHFDHAGGAAFFQRRYGSRIVMTEEDWALAAAPAEHPLFAFPAPRRDIVAQDGDVITLGDTQVTLFKTPGHTEGVLSLRYDVRDGDDTFAAITLGGVGLNFEGVARTEQYIRSYERLISMQDGIEVSLPNHAAMAQVFERRDQLANRKPGEPHPFVDGDAYRLGLARFLQGAMEKLSAEKAGVAQDPMEALQKVITPDQAHTSQNALDWPGLYSGMIPCADCEGIYTRLILQADNSYQLRMVYLGEVDGLFERSGKFEWTGSGNTIQLQGSGETPGLYEVGENQLFHLDHSGKRIEGELAVRYRLQKQTGSEIVGPKWSLVELPGTSLPLNPQRPPHFSLDAELRITGFAGCNRFFGQAELQADHRLHLGNLAATMMACPELPLETSFLKAMEQVDNFTLAGDQLTLNSATMVPLARFVR